MLPDIWVLVGLLIALATLLVNILALRRAKPVSCERKRVWKRSLRIGQWFEWKAEDQKIDRS